jgi:cytochrome c oxidase accessory protein FixG
MTTPGSTTAVQPQVVTLYRKEPKVYARAVKGRFARWRVALVVLTQLVFLGVPWLQWNGRQAVWFDLEALRFHLFGLVLQPQELVLLAALLVASALLLFLATAVAGRVWCGYACPQTVYSEIFQWIEHRTEGDRLARMRLDAAPWSAAKVGRRAAKHAGWLAVSAVVGLTFVGWFVPIRQLAGQLPALSIEPWPAFWALAYGAMTYGNAGFLREQMCKYICPYARFQSTLIDADSLIVAYDAARGDPRGSRPRHTDPTALGLGSCIDCSLCVQVCPTGIDIRRGLQNECIGCAACIDACDGVMDKIGDRRGLIRYATARGMATGLDRAGMLRRVVRPRVLAYAALLAAVVLAMGATLALRAPVSLDISRDRGALARIGDAGMVENTYRLQITNRTEQPRQVHLEAVGLEDLVVQGAPRWTLGPNERRSATLVLALPPQAAEKAGPGSHELRLRLGSSTEHRVWVDERAAFFGG